jgi:hypothetical protein
VARPDELLIVNLEDVQVVPVGTHDVLHLLVEINLGGRLRWVGGVDARQRCGLGRRDRQRRRIQSPRRCHHRGVSWCVRARRIDLLHLDGGVTGVWRRKYQRALHRRRDRGRLVHRNGNVRNRGGRVARGPLDAVTVLVAHVRRVIGVHVEHAVLAGDGVRARARTRGRLRLGVGGGPYRQRCERDGGCRQDLEWPQLSKYLDLSSNRRSRSSWRSWW